jgi:hypothetical protein
VKRLVALVLLFSLLVTPTALAAPKKIAVKPMQLLTSVGSPAEISGVVVSGKNLIVYGVESSKAYVRAIDTTGNELWKLNLDALPASIATFAAVDSLGDIWIAGSSPLVAGVLPPSNPAVPVNPDNAITPPSNLIPNLQVLTVWKVSAAGVLLATYTLPTSFVVLPTFIAVDKTGASIVGVIAGEKINAGFLVNLDLNGGFSNLLQIGSLSTTAEVVVRHANGSFTVTGSSAETLATKKLAGVVDGIIVKISKTLKITTVVRSSIAKGKRIWSSASTTLLLGGEVVAAGKSEIAVTKFTSSFAPTWTYRFPGSGQVQTIGSTQLLYLSTGAVSQLNWNPKVATPLLLTFDSKGAIVAADSVPNGQSAVIGALNSKELGILAITLNAESVSIYLRATR